MLLNSQARLNRTASMANNESRMSSPERPASPRDRVLTWLGVAFALVFPTIVTWAYFYRLASASEGVQQAVMAGLKGVQFALPVVWVCLVLRRPLTWRGWNSRGIALGLGFGLSVVAGGWLVFHFVLENSPPFIEAIAPIRAKVAGFGLDSVSKFVALGTFYALVHSVLEEYYWRWFAFGQLRRLVPLWPAIVVSALGFMAHHVLVLSLYFGWWSWPTLLFSTAVAVGGGFWAWLYARSGSLVGPWLSHLVVDAGIFAIGFEMLGRTFA
jgi:membrane protease YdiL (CAAX protease family)